MFHASNTICSPAVDREATHRVAEAAEAVEVEAVIAPFAPDPLPLSPTGRPTGSGQHRGCMAAH